MGKKGYNWKARQVVDTVIENNSKVKVELHSKNHESYDQCNTLVIPSSKRKTHKKKNNGPAVTKILSKTQRKKLEKIVERKKKKENRSSILEALAKIQAPEELYNHLTSISSLQTKGLKRHVNEEKKGVNSIAGSKKKRLKLLMMEEEDANDTKTKPTNDPNIVGVESSSESESDVTDNEEGIENSKPCKESNSTNEDTFEDLRESPVMSNSILTFKHNKHSNNFEISESLGLNSKNTKSCEETSGINGGRIEDLKESANLLKQNRISNSFEVSESIRVNGNQCLNIKKNYLGNANSKWCEETSSRKKSEDSFENVGEYLKISKSLIPLKPNINTTSFEVSDSIKNHDKPELNSDITSKTIERKSKNTFAVTPSKKMFVEKESVLTVVTPSKKVVAEKESVPTDVSPSKKSVAEKENVPTADNASKKVVAEKESVPTIYIPVNRDKKIQESRLKLPILGEEQTIMEAIRENPIVLLAGETGSGKTTQVPQFLYEAGYASGGKMIGITEPRRVAAISMSKRVAEELNMSTDKVSYLIRFEGNVTADTQIKFMTDGVLLKELQTDFLLTKYSVIILDEAHERSMYTDILIGLLSRIVPLRNKRGNPLKLIIMSATLRLTDFTDNTRLFKTPPPVIKVESRQFPVTVHFNKQTAKDYVREAYRKACKIHTQLPDGGILIFLTGQQEVNLVVKKLRAAFPFRYQKQKNNQKKKEKRKELDDDNEKEDDDELEEDLSAAINRVKQIRKKQAATTLPTINLDDYQLTPEDDTQGDMLDLDSEEGEDWEEEEEEAHTTTQPLWVLPLYSLLPSHKQAKVFEPPPEGCRLCVVATNVAETSLTIADVKYVVDAGKAKTRLYDKHTGVSAFDVVWTSKASANQRAGRAGRTSAGHCYRLYSSAVFNNEFVEWSVPEMQKRPVDELLLQMKALGIDRVVNFPFPSPPDSVQLCAAERRLTLLGALHPPRKGGDEFSSKLTALGQSMSVFPVAPRFAKMLCLSHQSSLLAYTVAIVAALSVQEFLLSGDKQWVKTRRQWAGVGHSLLLGDVMVLLRAVGAAEYANSTGNLEKFCADNGLRHKAVVESRKLRKQLTSELNLQLSGLNLVVDPKMSPPSDIQAKQLRQILLSGLVDQVARKLSEQELVALEIRKGKPVYRIPDMEEVVHLSATSALYKTAPEWIAYQEIFQTDKMYFRGVSAVEPEWLPVFAPSLCNLSTPLTEPAPRYNPDTGAPCCHFSGTFSRGGWTLPVFEMDFPEGLERYKWFAVFLLDGSVCPKLKKYTKSLLSTPHTMVKSWAALQPRTDTLLKALVANEVDCKSSLLQQWKEDSKYLLSAYLSWVPESAHNEVTIMWPPV